MAMHSLDSLDHPSLAPYRDLKLTNLTRWSGRFIAEGEKVVRRLLASSFATESVLMAESHRDRFVTDEFARTDLLILPDSLARELVGFQFHAGILACGVRQAQQLPPQLTDGLKQGTSLLVACERLTDPDNLGTLIRLCAAFGINGLLLGPGCADPFSRRTLRISMGNAFTLPIIETENLFQSLASLQHNGHTVIATMLHPDARPLATVARPNRMVLLLGNEAHGLSDHWLNHADLKAMIPMADGADSLNVALAAGIMLHYFKHLADPPRTH